MRPRRITRQGFTLAEVLVVLAVLGFLAALLIPAALNVRDQARITGCASKLMQIGLAMSQYADDHDSHYPPVPAPAPNCTWVDRIEPYVQHTSAFECPSDTTAEYRTGCPAPQSSSGVTLYYHGSYSINSALGFGKLSRRDFSHPDSTILVVDGTSTVFAFVTAGKSTNLTPTDLAARGVGLRHRDGATVVFADRHVKWLSAQRMSDRLLWFPGALPTPTAPVAP